MSVISENSRYHTTFDGEMNFADGVAVSIALLQPRDLDRGGGLYQSVGVAKLIRS